MNVEALIADLQAKDIWISRVGDKLKVEGPEVAVTPEVLRALKEHKAAILAALTPKPSDCAWHEDECGRLIFSDGCVYSLTATGGRILTRHPTKRMTAAGLVGVTATD